MEIFRKPDKEIYNKTSSTFYTSNDVSVEKKRLLGRHNKVVKCLFNYFKKNREAAVQKAVLLKTSQYSQGEQENSVLESLSVGE